MSIGSGGCVEAAFLLTRRVGRDKARGGVGEMGHSRLKGGGDLSRDFKKKNN